MNRDYMIGRNYRPPVVDFAKCRKSKTIPDQAMSIREIVKRFVRGIPVDVIQRDGVYVDQTDYDLERLSRMNFADKVDVANELREKAEAISAERIERIEREKEAREVKQAKRKAEAAEANDTGIGDLDNTMPVDTKPPKK